MGRGRARLHPVAGGIVAVSAADAFLGAHLVDALVACGCRVRALVPPGGAPMTEPLRAAGVAIVTGDMRDPVAVADLLDGVTAVVHIPPLRDVSSSYRRPRHTFEAVVDGALTLLQAAPEAGVERIVHVSCAAVYGEPAVVPVDEGHPLQAASPLAAAQIAAEKLMESHSLGLGLPVVVLRLFETYGPMQPRASLVGRIIERVAAESRPVLVPEPEATRDLLYATDAAAAIVAVLAAPAEAVLGEVMNLGSGVETSLADVALVVAGILGRDPGLVADPAFRFPGGVEMRHMTSDNRRLRTRTGWRPRVGLEDGLRATCAWLAEEGDLARPGAAFALGGR